MTSQFASSDGPKWKSIKEEHSEKHLMTHTCFRCSTRYPTSKMLIQHMKVEHSSFVTQPATRSEMPSDKPAVVPDPDRYRNAIATCPFCQHDCQTRKKLMRHLELEHKDDNEPEEEPALKVIRIDEQHKKKLLEQLSHDQTVTGPFVTPGASESKMVQSLLKVIGTTNNGLTNGKVDNKSSTKLQYKCFWCDASFRKRGKLMDHIDTLHKHNKQQNQAEAELLSMDEKPQHSRHVGNHRTMSSLTQLELPSYMPGLPYSSSPNHSLVRQSPHLAPQTTDTKPVTSNVTKCSFTLAGSLTNKSKSPAPENSPPNSCKFYLGKKDNPLANIKMDPVDRHVRDANSHRRFSLPNLFDDASSSSPYSFPFRMLQSNSIAAAMQHNYMMNIRPPMLTAAQFYAPPMPVMIPSSEYLLNQPHPMIDQQTQNSQAQFFARMNAMAQMSPLARPKTAESPLDLTKSYA